ncbi:MAG TPA: outer membrane protein assembly factor BamC, partial [Burkholderiales bacterium]|nr:outer membrane protein assembly factor BamC [Burkholderiales bacterium]
RREQPRAAAAASPTAVLPENEGMRVERAGTQRWLVVQEPPERVWPAVKAFWQELGFLVKLELPEAGVMETDWAESRARIQEGGVRGLLGRALDQSNSAGERDKFRTRLDRAPDGKGTEIYISHRGMQEVYTTSRDPVNSTPGDTRWQARNPDPGLEAEYLRRLMVRLGTHDEKARTLTATTEAQVPQMRAELRKGIDGREVLDVYEAFDRAWRRVGLALDRVGFTVEDRDRQKGLFFVRYADPEAEMEVKNRERGLFSRLFGSGDSKVKPEQYRVQVTQAGTSSQVNVLNKEGGADRSRTAQRILALLHEQLK